MSNWYLDELHPREVTDAHIHGEITACTPTTMEITMLDGNVVMLESDQPVLANLRDYPVGKKVALRCVDTVN